MIWLERWTVTYFAAVAVVFVASIIYIHNAPQYARDYFGAMMMSAYAIISWIGFWTAPRAKRSSLKVSAVVFTIGGALLFVKEVTLFH